MEISPIKLHPSSDPWLYSLSTLVMGTHVISYDKWSISYIPNIWNSEICRYASASWEFQAVKNNESLLCPPKSFKGRQPPKRKVTTKKIKRKPFRIFQESLLVASSHLSVSYNGFMSVGRPGTTIRNRNEWYKKKKWYKNNDKITADVFLNDINRE